MFPLVFEAAGLGLTAASTACFALGIAQRRVPKRAIPAAALMAAASIDMLTPGFVVEPVLWGALLFVAALALLAGRARREARVELAWHAGANLVMAGMWFAMAGAGATAAHATPLAHSHGGAGLGLLLLVAVLGLTVAAFRHASRAGVHESGPAPLRYPLMAVAMLAAMPTW